MTPFSPVALIAVSPFSSLILLIWFPSAFLITGTKGISIFFPNKKAFHFTALLYAVKFDCVPPLSFIISSLLLILNSVIVLLALVISYQSIDFTIFLISW